MTSHSNQDPGQCSSVGLALLYTALIWILWLSWNALIIS